MNRLIIAAVWIGFQGLLLIGWTIFETRRMTPHEGTSIMVRTEPVDPRDLLRGQYIQLSYPFSRGPIFSSGPITGSSNDSVWVLLRPDEAEQGVFHEPVKYSLNSLNPTQPDDVVIRGELERNNRIRFGIERYFVTEGTETPNPGEITVRLRIGSDDRPRIERVFVRGLPWPN